VGTPSVGFKVSDLTREEKALRRWLLALTCLFAAQAVAFYLPEVWSGSPDARPFAVNSFAKDVLFAALTGVAAADVRRFSRLIGLVIAGHLAIILLLAIALVSGRYEATFPPPEWQGDLSGPWPLAGWLGAAIAMTGVLIWLYRRALRARYRLSYLWPIEHDTLTAVGDAILDRPTVAPREIASSVDAYWAKLRIRAKWRIRLALLAVCFVPLLWLKAPLPLMDRPRRRRFIERNLLAEIARGELGFLRRGLQAAIRFAMQLVYIGYYGDERSHPATGYLRFSERPRWPGKPPPHTSLDTLAPGDVAGKRLDADVVVVGSGAGGAMAAHALASRGRDVLIVERGPHVDRSEFSESEPEMYARLYSDGALQLSRDFSVQVLQGMCVGGSTVVNNGVSFDLPENVLTRWNEHYHAGIDPEELQRSFDAVRSLVAVQHQNEAPPNPIGHRIGLQPVEANLEECLGCGNCNIGCHYGRKLSMLDRVLPETQRQYDDRLRILPECEAERILVSRGRATGVRCRLRSDGLRDRTVDIHARKAVVVAAGAIHSSLLLMRSRVGGDLVGRRLCANLGSHLTAYFENGPPLNAFDGLQMSHYANGGHAGNHVIETWFNPVMSQALVMPGWLGHHQTNMERYDRLSCLGVLVGSEPREGNRVLKRATMNGAQVNFTPSAADLDGILAGLREAGELLLENGATCVMPATFRYWELRNGDLQKLRRGTGGIVTDASDISVNTGHPQGGNPMSRDGRLGMVDQRFRVHGCENLHVCDASIFPSAITVNPQLTVMALAHLAGSTYIA
jgi:choline dehydrogenase-like flavoprotein